MAVNSGYVLRAATLADAAVLAAQRRAMFEAQGRVDRQGGAELEAATRRYLEQAIPAGTYYAWLIEAGAAAVAGGGVQLRSLMPRPGYVHGEAEGLILSMWTEPGHRRRGLAARVLEAILAWSETRGLRRLTLHASDMGRPLYARYGFTATNEMRLERDIVTAERAVDAALTPAIDALLGQTYAVNGTGAAVLAVQGGRTIFRAAYGLANLELAVTMHPDMVFRLASLTKQITAVAILMLVEEGRLALDATMSDLLPGYPRREQPVTVHQLLTHTSGVNSFRDPDQRRALFQRVLTMPEMLALAAEAPPESAPGERFRYNDAGYNLLGAIIQQVSGQTYEQFLQGHIFGPLGMVRTYYEHPEQIIPGRVTGYQSGANGLQNVQSANVSLAFAAGGLLSTLDDLARWHAALTANRLLRRETLELAYAPATLNDGTPVGYGYGWHIRSYEGHRLVEHGGEFAGFHNHAIRLPDDDAYVAVLTNQLPGIVPPSQLTMRIAALLLGKPYQEPVATALPADLLDRYCGDYQTRCGEVLTVGRDDDQLYMQPEGGTRQPIFPESPTSFFFRDSFARLTFREQADGLISGFQTQDRGGPVREARRAAG